MQCFNPEVQREITISSQKYVVNDKYYLVEFSDWDEAILDWLADRENVILTPEHMHVIGYLREMFETSKRHPVIRMITAELGRQFGTEKGTVKYFHSLFPGGIHQSFLIAGIPMQDSCC